MVTHAFERAMADAERQGLVRRWRESDRRVQRVELTPGGIAMFDRLRSVALRHDEKLRSRFTADELDQFAEFLDRTRTTIEAPVAAGAVPS